MNSQLDVDRSITAWLVAEAPDRAPQRLLEASRDQLRTTPQRRARWPAWRIPSMNAYAKLAVATAAVVVLAFLGINFFPRGGAVGGTPSIVPVSPSPSPSPTLLTRAQGPLEPGRYVTDPSDTVFTVAASFTLPVGWSNAGGAITKDDVVVSFWTVAETYGDPCQWESTKVGLGPTVDDLVAALHVQKDRNATQPVPTTLGGFDGQLIELDWPADVDQTACDPGAGGQGEYRMWIAPGPGDPSRWGSIGAHSVLRIADVDGTRVLVEVTEPPGITEAQRAEAQQVVDSIEFE